MASRGKLGIELHFSKKHWAIHRKNFLKRLLLIKRQSLKWNMVALQAHLTYLNVYWMVFAYNSKLIKKHVLLHWDEIETLFAEDDE